MRWLINYIRQCICKHDWELILDRTPVIDRSHGATTPHQFIWIYRCKKCGMKNKITSD